MPRSPRIVAAGLPHHVTQRGNYRQAIFFSDDDRLLYLSLLKEYSHRHRLDILGYCLMTNHIHLIVVPQDDDSMARALGSSQGRYAQYLHLRHYRQGHLWQSRFFSCVLEPAHLLHAMAYVERNPVRAGLCPEAADFVWSSAAAHAAGDADSHLDLGRWEMENWRQRLHQQEDAFSDLLRQRTWRGLPCGSTGFVEDLQNRLGRPIISRPPGRPRANESAIGRGGAI